MKWTGEKSVNLFLFLLSASYLAYALTHYSVGTLRLPKEGFLPALAGAGATLVSGFLLAQSLLGRGDAQGVKLRIPWGRFALLIGVSLAYALTLSTLGYTLGTFLLLLGVLKIAKLEGVVKPLLVALLSTAACTALFRLALGVMLPGGFVGI